MSTNSRKNSVRKPSVASLVRAAMLTMQEHKVRSTQASGTTISSSGAIIPLTNGIVEGDDVNMRSGTTIKMLQQHFRYAFNMTSSDQSARFIIFADMINTGVQPTVTEVLPTTGYLSHYSDVRQLQQKRFKILLDDTIDCSVNGPSRLSKKAEIKWKGQVFYNAATAVTTANGKGALFLLVIGSLNTGVYDYDWQCVYTDS
jgi:ribosomal protein S8